MSEYQVCIDVCGRIAYINIWFKDASEMMVTTRSWELDGVHVLSAVPLRKYS